MRGETDVGWLARRETEEDLLLVELFVATEYQIQGIGTRILRDLISEARRKNKSASLGVSKNNPARRLYEREGSNSLARTTTSSL